MSNTILPGYTRVSEISGAFVNYSNIPLERLENARVRGENVHKLIHLYLQDIPGTGEYSGYMKSFLSFWNSLAKPEILMLEQRLYCDSLMITGQMDLIIKDPIMGNVLIDWKCTYGVGKHWSIQAAGYAHLAFSGHPEGEKGNGYMIDNILFVRLDKDGKDPEVIQYEQDQDLFDKAYELYHMFLKDKKCYLEME